ETEVKLEIQDRVRSGIINLVWSYILDFENSQNPYVERSKEIIEWKKIAVENIIENESVLIRMRGYEKLGIKSKDALHISSAVQANCSYFITVDKGILNKRNLVQNIKICNPIEFIEEQE
ncbi:MAG: PIN domain protein, partial [Spirochaetia bacterium]|nr:PIN domain protein [Spirochaetia bacterium]